MGKTLLIHGEQGLGDEIMFGQIVADIPSRDATIIWACQPPLVRLVAQSNPCIEVVGHQVIRAPADLAHRHIDYQIPLCSLGRLFRRVDADFTESEHGLTPVASEVAVFEQRLLAACENDTKLRVGLMWGANPAHGIDWGRQRSLRKSIPVERLSPLARHCDRVQFVSLQNRDAGIEAALAPELDMLDFHDTLLDMADTAALIENLDLVISVDTSIAHLSGAMGKPVWVLLMDQCDWRWQHEKERSVWYRSARLFRQKTQGRWDEVVDELDSALERWLQQ